MAGSGAGRLSAQLSHTETRGRAARPACLQSKESCCGTRPSSRFVGCFRFLILLYSYIYQYVCGVGVLTGAGVPGQRSTSGLSLYCVFSVRVSLNLELAN